MNLPARSPNVLKKLGAFYTPPGTASSLVEWAMRSGNERILEPSFGGCALIDAAITRSIELVGRSAVSVVGVDIDRQAITRAAAKCYPANVIFLEKDFLETSADELGLFEAVLSNPPFTRNHSIEPQKRLELRTRFGVSGAAGLWVHFVLHSMAFLKRGGALLLSYQAPLSSRTTAPLF